MTDERERVGPTWRVGGWNKMGQSAWRGGITPMSQAQEIWLQSGPDKLTFNPRDEDQMANLAKIEKMLATAFAAGKAARSAEIMKLLDLGPQMHIEGS